MNVESLEFPVDGLAQAVSSRHRASSAFRDASLERIRVELRRDGEDWRVVRADRAAADYVKTSLDDRRRRNCERGHFLRLNRMRSAPTTVCERAA